MRPPLYEPFPLPLAPFFSSTRLFILWVPAYTHFYGDEFPHGLLPALPPPPPPLTRSGPPWYILGGSIQFSSTAFITIVIRHVICVIIYSMSPFLLGQSSSDQASDPQGLEHSRCPIKIYGAFCSSLMHFHSGLYYQ